MLLWDDAVSLIPQPVTQLMVLLCVQAARPEVWKFLLGVYPADSTAEQRRALRQAKAAEYAQLKQQWQTISRPQAQRFAKWREVPGPFAL